MKWPRTALKLAVPNANEVAQECSIYHFNHVCMHDLINSYFQASYRCKNPVMKSPRRNKVNETKLRFGTYGLFPSSML